MDKELEEALTADAIADAVAAEIVQETVVDSKPKEEKKKPGPKPKIGKAEVVIEKAPDKIFFPNKIRTILNHSILSNQATLLVGDTGTGKTSYVRELAREHKKRVIRINLTGQTSPDEFVGKILANEKGTYWQDGPVVMAMREGHWVVLDEVNMAPGDILSRIHSLLDDDKYILLSENSNEIVNAHPEFRFFATMNPPDEYAGTKELNKAFLSRFPIIVNCDYSEKESEILVSRTKVSKPIADQLVLIAKEIRVQKGKNNLSYICSTRDLISCANLVALGLDLPTALEISILNKAMPTEREPIMKIISLMTSNSIKFPSGEVFTSVIEIIEKAKKHASELSDAKKEAEKYKIELEKSIRERDKLKVQVDEFVPALDRERERNRDLAKKVQESLQQLSKLTE